MASFSSSQSRPAKLQKLNHLRRSCPYVSQAALEALLTMISKEGMPEVRTSKAMKEATRQQLDSMNAYGPLLHQATTITTDGGSKQIWLVNALSLLAGAYHQGGAWASMLQRTHQKTPSTFNAPWKLFLYADELLPGNALAHRQERKCWAIYGSFSQFTHLLATEDAWFILSILRSPDVAELPANIGQVFAQLMHLTFCSTVANPAHGLLLPHAEDHTKDIRLFFTMGGWLQDGLSMKYTFSTKGDSGDKFCTLCNNIRAQSMPVEPDAEPHEEEDILGSHVTTLAECALATDQDLLQGFQTCKQKKACLNKEDFLLWQQASGIAYNDHALLLDEAPVHVLHVLFSIQMLVLIMHIVFSIQCLFACLFSISCFWDKQFLWFH